MSNEIIKQERALSLTGAIYQVNDGLLQVIQYESNKRVYVRFVQSGYTTWTTMMNIKAKQVKDKFKPTVCGIGYTGDGCSVQGAERKKLYHVWRNMLVRLNDPVKFPTYVNVELDPSWRCFSNFANDVIQLPGYEHFMTERDVSLDKDSLSGERKRYSRETTCWVSKAENTRIMVEEREQKRKKKVTADIAGITW